MRVDRSLAQRRAGVAGLAATAVLLASCSSSGGSGTTGTNTSAANQPATTAAVSAPASSPAGGSSGSPTGSPLKVMLEGAISGPVYALPEMVTGAQAGVNRVNSEGGINGHPLQLESCDDQGNPNNDASCGRKAVSDGVLAVVGGLSVYDQQFIPPLAAAKIPYIASSDINPLDHQSPVSFPINAAIMDYHGTAEQLARRGCTQAAILAPDQPGVDDGIAQVEDGFKRKNVTNYKAYKFSPTTSNFTSLVATALSGGAKCFALTAGPQAVAEILLAIKKSGHIVPVDVNITAIANSLDAPVGFPSGMLTANGTYYLPDAGATGDTATVLDQFVSDMKAVNAKGQAAETDALAENAYNSILLLRDVAKPLSDLTPQAVLTAMGSFKADTGLTAPIDFSGKGPFTGYPQDHAATEITYMWTGSKLQLAGDPIDVAG